MCIRDSLLLGLIREGEGVAAQVLMNLDVTAEAIRKQVITLLGGGQGQIFNNMQGKKHSVSAVSYTHLRIEGLSYREITDVLSIQTKAVDNACLLYTSGFVMPAITRMRGCVLNVHQGRKFQWPRPVPKLCYVILKKPQRVLLFGKEN